MESLKDLDVFSEYDLGVLYEKVLNSNNYIRIQGEDYIKTDEELCNLLIFTCNQESTLTICKVSVKIKPNVTYYIKPYVKLDKTIFTVYSYVGLDNLKMSRAMLHVEEKVNPMYDELYSHIGYEKVLLDRWPFKNVKLEKFLDYCDENNIDYKILLKKSIHSKRFYEYDPEKKVQVDDCYDIKMYNRFKLEYNAIIFNGIGHRLKKVVHVLKKRLRYNGSSLTSDEDDEDTAYENAVILFNPQTATKDDVYNILGNAVIDDYCSDTSEEDFCDEEDCCEPYQENPPRNTLEWNYI